MVSGCVAPSPCRPKLRRPNLSLGLGLARICNRLGLGLGLAWGDVNRGDKAMGRHGDGATQPTFFVNNQLVASCQLGFLIMFLFNLDCFFQIIKSGVPVT